MSRFAMYATIALIAWLAVHAALRAYGLFGPVEARKLILASFMLLWPTPWIMLTREERRAIGFGPPPRAAWWLIAPLMGAVFAVVAFGACYALYGASADNPFVSIRQSFLTGPDIPTGLSPMALFLIFTGPALIASPVGEEFLSRAVIHQRAAAAWGPMAGPIVSASVFAGLHLMHHGITYSSGAVSFIGASGLLWFALTFAVSLMFTALRKRGGTIWLAVLAHAGFNFAMNAAIFSVLVA